MLSKNVRILLFPVSDYDRKRDAEFIENNNYDIHQLEALPNDVQVYELSEFMDLCNNEEFVINDYWVTYVNFIDESIIDHNKNIDTLIKSCEEGRDGDWDVSTNEGLEGFNDMITLLERSYITNL